jgi:hypothetical protein
MNAKPLLVATLPTAKKTIMQINHTNTLEPRKSKASSVVRQQMKTPTKSNTIQPKNLQLLASPSPP